MCISRTQGNIQPRIVRAVLTQSLRGIPDFPICGQSGPRRFPFPAESGNGVSLFPDPGRIGKRGFPPRFPAKSGIGARNAHELARGISCGLLARGSSAVSGHYGGKFGPRPGLGGDGESPAAPHATLIAPLAPNTGGGIACSTCINVSRPT